MLLKNNFINQVLRRLDPAIKSLKLFLSSIFLVYINIAYLEFKTTNGGQCASFLRYVHWI